MAEMKCDGLYGLVRGVLERDRRHLRTALFRRRPDLRWMVDDIPKGARLVDVWDAVCANDLEAFDRLIQDFGLELAACAEMVMMTGLPYDFFYELMVGTTRKAFAELYYDFEGVRSKLKKRLNDEDNTTTHQGGLRIEGAGQMA